MQKIKSSDVADYLVRDYIIFVETAEDVRTFLRIARSRGYKYDAEEALLSAMQYMTPFGFRVAYDQKTLLTRRIDEYLPRVIVQFANDGIAFVY